jgi:predicted dinucleotide-binding enzyme
VRVLVNGTGNIGTTLANLLLAHRSLLGIGEVVVAKFASRARSRDRT